MLWFVGYFPSALSLALFSTSVDSGVFFFFLFFQLVLFKCLPHPLRGQYDSLFPIFFLFLFLFGFVFFVFVFFFFVSLPFCISWKVYVVPVVSSMITCHRIPHGVHCIRVNVVSLCSFVTRDQITCIASWIEESARTLVVLDVDGWKERFNVKNTRTKYDRHDTYFKVNNGLIYFDMLLSCGRGSFLAFSAADEE
ncbi:MAG: hypothetical protein ABJQ14_09625 [Hyphomicrobiales bacterium]